MIIRFNAISFFLLFVVETEGNYYFSFGKFIDSCSSHLKSSLFLNSFELVVERTHVDTSLPIIYVSNTRCTFVFGSTGTTRYIGEHMHEACSVGTQEDVMSVYADPVSPVAKYASIVQHVLRLPRFSTRGESLCCRPV